MLFVISPAKSLDFEVKNLPKTISQPIFLDKSEILIKKLRKFSTSDLSKLMKISDKLAELNFDRYQNFQTPFNLNNAKPALFVFNGDVYDGIDETNYSQAQLDFAQNNLRILSGLYGVLRPLDLIQAYRLEMGTKLENEKGKNLYEFWQNEVTNYFNEQLKTQNSKIIVNLASNEYLKAIDKKKLDGKILNITFKSQKNGVHKNIGIFAKKARGLMVDFIVKNEIRQVEDLKKFNANGYKFDGDVSSENEWCFYD